MSRHSLVGPEDLADIKRDFMFNFCINQDLFVFDKFLDIGSGTLRNSKVIECLDKGNYFGIEINEERYNEGLKELSDRELSYKEPDLRLVNDFEGIEYDYKFDFVFAFSVLIHLTDDKLDKCLEFVSDNIKPDAPFYANVNIGCRTNSSWNEFPVVWRSLDFYTTLAWQNGLTCVDMGSLASLGHNTGNELGDAQRMLRFSYKTT
jgi:SAM-dependent methyltransferase